MKEILSLKPQFLNLVVNFKKCEKIISLIIPVGKQEIDCDIGYECHNNDFVRSPRYYTLLYLKNFSKSFKA